MTETNDRNPGGSKPLVAIVGRPNVGKSTLFNRLVGRKTAIVDDQPGVTRDRIYGVIEWGGRTFDVVDTGGLIAESDDTMVKSIYGQVLKAVQDAACIIFLTDIADGVTPGDEDVADVLRRSGKQIIVVVNKADNHDRSMAATEMYSLGLGTPHPISATHGIGVGDLLDVVLEIVPEFPDDGQPSDAIRIAIVGQPNVGKSSLVNKLLQEDRVIVDDKAGTTRDSIDAHFRLGDDEFVLVDTAGLKRPNKVERGSVEQYSVGRATGAIRRCDIALLMIDSSREDEITEQDCRISNLIESSGRAQLIAMNKWDLGEKDHRLFDETVALIRDKMPNLAHVPIISISAKTGLRLNKIFGEIKHIYKNYHKRIPTSELNDFFQGLFLAHAPRIKKGAPPKLLYVTQAAVAPPTFIIFMNRADSLEKSYLRYIENRLREQYDFAGVPFRFEVRRKAGR
jgi:GTP-binding protein